MGYLSTTPVLKDDNCSVNLKILTTMIRSIKVAAVVFAVVAMAACGGAKKAEATTDSTAVMVDSAATMMADSASTMATDTAAAMSTSAVESTTK